MLPIISVIVPIYGIEKYIKQCVDSLLCQPFENIEVILVDDGSPDNCPKICDEYAKSDSRVRVLHKSNGGLVSARKAGLNIATGKYIATVDGDDWVSPNFFECILKIIDEYSPDIIHFNRINMKNTEAIEVPNDLNVGMYTEEDIQQRVYPILIENEFTKTLNPGLWVFVIKREIYKECQLAVDNRIKVGEDAACSKPAIYRAKSLYVTHDCLYYYRVSPDSMTRSKKPFNLEDTLLIGQSLETQIDMTQFDFQAQVYRYVVHNLFNACASRFYSKKKNREVVAELKECLDVAYYKKAICECGFNKKNLQGNLALFALKYKLYFLMKLYCRWPLKRW